MNKTERLNILFDQWEDEISGYKDFFVRDGIINEEEWNKTNPKILFIAKEANHYENPKPADFREDWRNGNSKYPFAYRIAEWAFGIIEGFKKFSDIEYHEDLYQKYLQKIAFMNIKKLGGGGSSLHYNLINHLRLQEHVIFLQRQIKIIEPNIIILGLSFSNALRETLFPGINNEMEQCGYSIEVSKINNIKIVDFYHPSSRNGPSAAYSLLQNVIQSEVFKNLR